MTVANTLAKAVRNVRRRARLSPIFQVARKLKQRGVDLHAVRGVELFAGTGVDHTWELAQCVRNLEVWEIDPACEVPLQTNLSNARVKIVDSYHQMRITEELFEFVSADNFPWEYDDYYEHFELFPSVFHMLASEAVLLFNVTTNWNERRLSISDEHRRRRCEFYQCHDPARVTLEHITGTYKKLAETNGFQLRWWFAQDRYLMYPFARSRKKWRLHYMVLALKRVRPRVNDSPASIFCNSFKQVHESSS